MKLSDDGKSFLLGFCNDDYVAEESKGIIVGDKVLITSGSFMGMERVIRSGDRHKRRGEIVMVWFGE